MQMGGSTEKEIFVTAAEQQPVMVTAMAQPVMVMAQPVEESTQQYPQLYPQPVVVATTTTSWNINVFMSYKKKSFDQRQVDVIYDMIHTHTVSYDCIQEMIYCYSSQVSM